QAFRIGALRRGCRRHGPSVTGSARHRNQFDDRLEEEMRRDARRRGFAAFVVLVLAVAAAAALSGSAAAKATSSGKLAARGALDCNGFSPAQQSLKPTGACTDVRGFNG